MLTHESLSTVFIFEIAHFAGQVIGTYIQVFGPQHILYQGVKHASVNLFTTIQTPSSTSSSGKFKKLGLGKTKQNTDFIYKVKSAMLHLTA